MYDFLHAFCQMSNNWNIVGIADKSQLKHKQKKHKQKNLRTSTSTRGLLESDQQDWDRIFQYVWPSDSEDDDYDEDLDQAIGVFQSFVKKQICAPVGV